MEPAVPPAQVNAQSGDTVMSPNISGNTSTNDSSTDTDRGTCYICYQADMNVILQIMTPVPVHECHAPSQSQLHDPLLLIQDLNFRQKTQLTILPPLVLSAAPQTKVHNIFVTRLILVFTAESQRCKKYSHFVLK